MRVPLRCIRADVCAQAFATGTAWGPAGRKTERWGQHVTRPFGSSVPLQIFIASSTGRSLRCSSSHSSTLETLRLSKHVAVFVATDLCGHSPSRATASSSRKGRCPENGGNDAFSGFVGTGQHQETSTVLHSLWPKTRFCLLSVCFCVCLLLFSTWFFVLIGHVSRGRLHPPESLVVSRLPPWGACSAWVSPVEVGTWVRRALIPHPGRCVHTEGCLVCPSVRPSIPRASVSLVHVSQAITPVCEQVGSSVSLSHLGGQVQCGQYKEHFR